MLDSLFTHLIFGAAMKESAAAGHSRTLQYPKVFKILVVVAWAFVAGVAVLVVVQAKRSDLPLAAGVAGGFFAMVLFLHVETFGVRITYDDKCIYTRSRWRRRRVIPFHAVTSCDFSRAAQWYRIRTRDHGVVRLPVFLSGIPGLLKALPCPAPPYPPGR